MHVRLRTMAFDWQPREPDADRARSYVRAGFWNDELESSGKQNTHG